MVYEIEHDDPNLRGKFIYGVADTAIFASDNGVPVSEDFEKWGIYFEKEISTGSPARCSVITVWHLMRMDTPCSMCSRLVSTLSDAFRC